MQLFFYKKSKLILDLGVNYRKIPETKTIGVYCFPDDDKIGEDFINKIYESNG